MITEHVLAIRPQGQIPPLVMRRRGAKQYYRRNPTFSAVQSLAREGNKSWNKWTPREYDRNAKEGYKIVKVYVHGNEHECTILDVEIGYMEQRLTALERLRAVLYAVHYWDIPF